MTTSGARRLAVRPVRMPHLPVKYGELRALAFSVLTPESVMPSQRATKLYQLAAESRNRLQRRIDELCTVAKLKFRERWAFYRHRLHCR